MLLTSCPPEADSSEKDGTPGGIRTRDLPLRRRLLYPTELMPQQKEHYRVMPFHPGFWYRNGCEMFFACQRSFGCGLVSSEVSHRTATMVSRCRACRAWLAHSGYPLGHVPRIPRTASTHVPYAGCSLSRMSSYCRRPEEFAPVFPGCQNCF